MKKLFIGGLPFSVNNEELAQLFSQFGEVESAKVIIDRMSGRSKGFGFVEYTTEEAAQAAITNLNGFDMQGRYIKVTLATPQEESAGPRRPFNSDRGGFDRGGRGGNGGGGRGGNGGRSNDRGGDRGGNGYSRNDRNSSGRRDYR